MDDQRRVARFVAEHDLACDPEYRALDLASEVGELAKELTESTDYGAAPGDLAVADDELGDALFALLALCDSVDVDAREALDESMAKYGRRLDDRGTPSSSGA